MCIRDRTPPINISPLVGLYTPVINLFIANFSASLAPTIDVYKRQAPKIPTVQFLISLLNINGSTTKFLSLVLSTV